MDRANDRTCGAAVLRSKMPPPLVPKLRQAKHALELTNRDDRQLAARPSEALGLSAIDVASVDPRRISAAGDAVAALKFDIMLAVTGSMNHSTDGVMKSACDRAGITYVRVAKGRPAACVRALAPEFGNDTGEAAA